MAKAKSNSRAARWNDAVGRAREALDAAKQAFEDLTSAMSDLADVKSEYEDWQGNLPDSLRYSPVGEKLDAVVAINTDLDESSSLEEWEAAIDEAEGADLPLGFGRD